MPNEKKKYDSTVARIAGNIAGHLNIDELSSKSVARIAVDIARAIVVEVERTEVPREG